MFRVLGDDTRLQILLLLGQRESWVCELVELFGLSQSAISEPLLRLKDGGLTFDARRGMWVFYRLNDALPEFVTRALQAADLEPEFAQRLHGLKPIGAVCARAPQAQAGVLTAVT